MEKEIDLSVIILSYNTKDLTIACLESLLKYTKGINYEIIVVDNASSDGSVEELNKLTRKDKRVALLKSKTNLGYTGGNNYGTESARGRYLLFANSDTEVKDNVLGEMTEWLKAHPQAGLATCRMVGERGQVQETGGYSPTLLRVFSWMTIQDLPLVDHIIKPFHPLKIKSPTRADKFFDTQKQLDWLIGAFLFIKRDIFEKVGGWDNDYFMYGEDVDLSFKVKKVGFKAYYLPQWQIIHYGGASSQTKEFPLLSEYSSIKLFYKKHYPFWHYPILRLILKIGALGRMILFGILEGKEAAKIYAKAFKLA